MEAREINRTWPKEFMLTWTVELKTSPTFTARRFFDRIFLASEYIAKMEKRNEKCGRIVYSNFHIHQSTELK
jgi:hypothetical protein